MAPTTFTLISSTSGNADAFLDELKAHPSTYTPLWLGKCQHWIHQPHFSTKALNGTGPELQKWDYLVVTKAQLPPLSHIKERWSITAEVQDDLLSALKEAQTRRETTPSPPLPSGWSHSDHSGLDAAIAPPDLEASLAMSSQAMGSPQTSEPIVLKDYIRSFGSTYTGPIVMFNLLSYHPEQRVKYFKYVEAFQQSVGSKYGGEPVFLGFGVLDWSSQGEEEEQDEGRWEDTALIHYPSLWHFGKMLDDEAYVDADRKYKQGVLRDNPLLCCTEVRLA